MRNWKKNIRSLSRLKNSNIKKAIIYIILWASGSIVACSILVLWNKAGNFESITVFNKLEKLPKGQKAYNNIVDELLLSANELNIYDKSSLMEYNYKRVTSEPLIQQIKSNPDKAYKIILKNKLDKLNNERHSTSDFNVKPVPK